MKDYGSFNEDNSSSTYQQGEEEYEGKENGKVLEERVLDEDEV